MVSEGTFDDISAIHVLQNIREGDVVWVVVHSGVDDEAMEAVQHVLQHAIEANVCLIVSKQGYVESLRKMPLSELLSLQSTLDEAILTWATHNAVVE